MKQCTTSETDLIRRLRAGEANAFYDLVGQYNSRIHRAIYGVLGNQGEADDIAQEVFAKVHFAIGSFDGRSSLFTWIHRITVNECYTYLRKRRVIVYENDFPDGKLSLRMRMVADTRPTAGQTAMQRDLLNKLLTRISKADRALLIRKEVEGISIAELSQLSGLNENMIKVRLHRARRRLVQAAAMPNRGEGLRPPAGQALSAANA